MSTLQPSLLMYLFADRFLEPKGFRHAGIAVPCRDDVEVRLDSLAPMMFAGALWSLREAGLVALELQSKKRLGLIPTTKVVVRRAGDAVRPGLEGVVLETLLDSGDDDVKDLIRRWFGSDVESPHHDVVAVEIEEAIRAGLLARVETDAGRGRVLSTLLGSTKVSVEPQCDRIATVEGVDDLLARWQHFAATEPDLHTELVERCGKAITSRTEADDVDFD
jgi:hypothetical protein